ncbi:MAG: hypothetical protein AAFW00_26375 [Bacteroidota bacterium]
MSALTQYQNNHPGIKTAATVAQVGSSLYNIFNELVSLGKSSLSWLLFIVSIPLFLVGVLTLLLIFFFFSIKVLYSTKKLQAKTSELALDLERFLQEDLDHTANLFSLEEYVQIKNNQDSWLQMEGKLFELVQKQKKVKQQVRSSSAKPLLRIFLRPYGRFFLAFREYNVAYARLLKAYDEKSPKGNFFQPASEVELWKSRNKAYDYLV